MRSVLLLAALAALACGAMAGPYQAGAGCYNTDTVKSYPIEGFNFRDFAKGQFVKQAFVQSKSRMRRWAEVKSPFAGMLTGCDFDGVKPKKGCYNSIAPGTLAGPQVAGQYGFEAELQYVCLIPEGGFGVMKVACKSRLNTLRDNRLLDPSFWQGPTGAAKDIICAEPELDF